MYKTLTISALTLSLSAFAQQVQAGPSAVGCATQCTPQACAAVDVARKCLNECNGVLLHKVCENTVAAADNATRLEAERPKRTISIGVPLSTTVDLYIKTDVMNNYKKVSTHESKSMVQSTTTEYVLTDEDIKGSKTINFAYMAKQTGLMPVKYVRAETMDKLRQCGSSLPLGRPVRMTIVFGNPSKSTTENGQIITTYYYICSIAQ